MSRSQRKTPIIGNSPASSEKKDKRIASGKFRTLNRVMLKLVDTGDFVAPVERAVGEGVTFGKKGKSYITQKTASQKHGLQDLRELIGK